MVWYRLASHLCMTVQEVQAKITSSEFLEWAWYLNWRDTEEFNRQDFYLANIAASVDRGNVKHPRKIKLENYILKFHNRPNQDSGDKMRRSKQHWLTLTGVIGNKKNQKKKQLPNKKKE